MKLNIISTGEPTYWPTDSNKIPDLIDFCLSKGIANAHINCQSSLDLSSDHSPVIITLNRKIATNCKPCKLHNNKTDWPCFRQLVTSSLNNKLALQTDDDIIEAVEHFNNCIQQSAWNSTPVNLNHNDKIPQYSMSIREMISEKRKARKRWQETRFPYDKTQLNSITAKLKQLLNSDKNQGIQTYLKNLNATAATDYSLWKATKKLKRPILIQSPIRKKDNTWAKNDSERVETFAEHLHEVFVPNSFQGDSKKMDEVLHLLNRTHQLDLPISKFTKSEVTQVIRKLNQHKAPGYDLITAKILRELPEEAIIYLTQLYNAIIKRGFVPQQWKVAQVIMILKPGKRAEDVLSYRPISLLPIPSKVLEILFLKRLMPIIEKNQIIPNYQFGFRQKHSTIEQIHRLVEKINTTFEQKNTALQYSSTYRKLLTVSGTKDSYIK